MIAAGRVQVGGKVVTDPARDVDESSGVEVDGKPVAPESREVWLVNKPAGVVSTAADTHGRPIITGLVKTKRRLYPVGRLDADTTGLILLTNDGDLANRLTHPRYGVQRVYRARVDGVPSQAALRKLREGVELEDGMTSPAKVRQVEPNLIELTITEGRKRQVKRMCEAVGHRVRELERIAFGPLRLGDMGRGKARLLTPAEVARLGKSAESGS